jgi:ribosomal protein S6
MEKEVVKKDYEIGFLSREEGGPDELRKFIIRSGGEILLEGPVERIALAYKIEKELSAYFGYFHFSMDPAAVKAMEIDLNTAPFVLRYLIITPPFVKTKPRGVGRPKAKALPTPDSTPTERKPAVESLPLSNEALERKIEEILQQ